MSNEKRTIVYVKHDYFASLTDGEGKRKYKYIIHTGSSRSSKTTSIIQWINEYCENIPNTRATVWRDTRTSLASTVWTDFRRLYAHKHKFTKHATPLHYDNGSTFEPHGADFTNAHGLTQNIAWLNEPYKITKETFDAIDQRSDLIIIDWNPKTGHWIEDIAKSERSKVIHSTYKDNPFCPEEQRIKIESYEPYQSGSYEVVGAELYYKGNPITENNLPPVHEVNVKNGTANLHNWLVYGLGIKAEKPNKIYHGWNTCTLDEFKNIDATEYFGIDFGQRAPTAIIRGKYDGDTTLYLDQVFYKPMSDEGSYPNLLEKLGISKNAVIMCDSAKPEIIISIKRAGWAMCYGVKKPKGSVIAGIQSLQNIKVRLTKRSEDIWSEYDDYEWNVDRYGYPTDDPIKKNDHAMDAIRYMWFDLSYKILKLNL